MSEMFKYLDIETYSLCNRRCPTCIRNSHPDRDATKSWFEGKSLPMKSITKILNQVRKMGFTGSVCLSHYNEPLMDTRIGKIAKIVKSYGIFNQVYLHTNGDFLTEKKAQSLDGWLDKIVVTLYMAEPIKSERAKWIRTLFKVTGVEILTESEHIATHFSPKFNVKALAEQYIDNTCPEPEMRVIINHRGQYLLCCDDVVGNFDLGTFPELSIKDYWFGEKRTRIENDLRNIGGRRNYTYCSTCPRT